MLVPYINNRNNFLFREHPQYHPESINYLKYWREQKRRCIEGYWGQDTTDSKETGMWRFMPPQLYFYANFCKILHKNENAPKTAPRKKVSPNLDDIDWDFFYKYLEARGFSGFNEDEEFTCCRDVDLFERKLIEESILPKTVYNKKGKIKKYTPVREYILKLFDKPLGIPLYDNEAKNLALLGPRGSGKSYWIAQGCVLHEVITDGAKEYTEDSMKSPAKVEIFVGSSIAAKSSEMLEKTKMAMDELPGVWKKGTTDEVPAPFYKKMSGSLSPNNIKNPWRSEYEKKIAGEWKVVGSGSSVKHGIWTIENPEAAAGGRYNLVVMEEFGLVSNSISVHMSNIPTMYIEYKFGTAIYIGTGGNIEKIQQTQIIFTDPEGFDCLEFDDIWENTGKIGYFLPATYTNRRFKDKNGNTLVAEAEHFYNSVREKKRKAKSGNALDMEMMNYPLIPSEMFLNKAYNKFPIADLKQTLSKLLTDDKLLNASWRGYFGVNTETGKSEWINTDNYPIREFPLKSKDNIEGCWEIYAMPIKDNDGAIPYGRYIAACLPPGEKVLTSEGLKNIENVTNEDFLLNQEGNKVKIDKFISHNVIDEDIYEIKVANTLRTTTFTQEHPILTSKCKNGYVSYPRSKRLNVNQRYKKFNFNYTTVNNVTTEDWIKFPNIYLKENDFDVSSLWNNDDCRIDRQIVNPINNKDFWWFIGLWLGDGWCNSNGYTISIVFNKNEISYIKKCKKIISELFNRKVSTVEQETTTICVFSFKQLHQFLSKHFKKYSYGKIIPEWAKKIEKELKLNLILGYLDSDGSIIKYKTKTKLRSFYYYTEFVSVNLQLLESIQDILFSVGIISSLTKLKDAQQQVRIVNSICNTRTKYHLRISHKDTISLVILLNDFNDLKISRINFDDASIYNTQKQTIGCFLSDDLTEIYFKVQKISKNKYTGKVYNFECDTHTFLCNHITTHNCDPVDDDDNQDVKRSLQSTFVLDTFTDRIVAEYSGRTKFAKDYYEQLRRGLLFFNGRLLYENQKKGLFAYFEQKNALYLLEDTPELLKDVDMQKISTVGNRAKGAYATEPLKRWGIDLYAQWLMSQATSKEDGVTNTMTLRSVGLIRESIIYSKDINTDRISSIIILMIYRETKVKYVEKKKNSSEVYDMSKDKFWDKHFTKRQTLYTQNNFRN